MAPDEAEDRGQEQVAPGGGKAARTRAPAAKAAGSVGKALRSVWQGTLDEQVPDDMIDLLGKLS